MTRARLEAVPPDPATGRTLVLQARRGLRSAESVRDDRESAYGLAYQATLKAAIAVLLAGGKRVSSGSGGHIVILHEAGRLLPSAAEPFARVDHMRRTRHNLFYGADEIGEAELAGALADADAVVRAASERLA